MSLESLGSLARTVSDKFLRDNLRRIISGTNVSISSVLDGFRSHDSQAPTEEWAEPLQCSEPQSFPSAFEDLARGTSYVRQGSDHLLKRRNSSVGRRSGQLSRDGASRAPDLRTIYSAASLGYPVSPRAQKKPVRRQQQQKQEQTRWRWSKIITAAVFIAWAILGVSFLTGTWLPHHDAQLAQEGQSRTATWRLLSLLQPSSPRRLLEESEAKFRQMGTAPHRHATDAFSAAAVRVQEREQAGRWGQHMAARMSRSLAEGDTSATGNAGAAATAEAPSIAAITTFRSGDTVTTSAQTSSQSSSSVSGTQSAGERAATAGSSGSGGGSGASVSGAAFVGASLLQQDGSASQALQQTSATEGGANTLQYSNGYVNVTGPHYRVVEHTQNRDVCAAACASDSVCAAWTRVAAGRADVQACYLKSSIADMTAQRTAAVQYVAPSQASQVVLESGTKQPDALPSALYGCPYPPSRNGGCRPPPTCNCYQGVCYGDC